MRILVVSCVYPPEPVVSAQTSADLVSYLHAMNDSVTVLAPFPSRPAGQGYLGYKRRPYRVEHTQLDSKTIRCFSFFSKRLTFLSRFSENISFGITQRDSRVVLAKTRRALCQYMADICYRHHFPGGKTAWRSRWFSVFKMFTLSRSMLKGEYFKTWWSKLMLSMDGIIARGVNEVIVIVLIC